MVSSNNFGYYPPKSIAQKFGNTIDRMNYEDLRKQYMTEADSRLLKRRQNIPSVIVNKYMNDEDYLKIFLKMSPSDYKLIQKNSDLDPYWKPGLKFTLFSTENKDSFYVKNHEILEKEIDSMNVVKRKLRFKRKSMKDSTEINSITAQMNSITSSISDKRKNFNDIIDTFEEKKLQKTINAFLDLTDIEINDSDAKPDLDCYFFQHSNDNEKGLMCMYPMDSLTLGKQELYYYKKNENNSRSVNVKIPFYKVRSNN